MSNLANLVERAAWTAVQSFCALLSADGFGWLDAAPWQYIATAAVASVLSALKTLAQGRLQELDSYAG